MHNRSYHPLPKKLFKVRVPVLATYSKEELELLGIPLSIIKEGDGEDVTVRYDKNSYRELVTVSLPLSKIIDIYCDGMRIQVVDHKDTLEIFRLLENYIAGIESTPHMLNMENKVPDERLENIKKFAQDIYAMNVGRIHKGITIDMENNPFRSSIGFMPRVDKPKVVHLQPKKYIDNTPKLDFVLPQEYQQYPFKQPVRKPIEQPIVNYQSQQIYDKPQNQPIINEVGLSPMPKYVSNYKKLPHSDVPNYNIIQIRQRNAIICKVESKKGD